MSKSISRSLVYSLQAHLKKKILQKEFSAGSGSWPLHDKWGASVNLSCVTGEWGSLQEGVSQNTEGWAVGPNLHCFLGTQGSGNMQKSWQEAGIIWGPFRVKEQTSMDTT